MGRVLISKQSKYMILNGMEKYAKEMKKLDMQCTANLFIWSINQLTLFLQEKWNISDLGFNANKNGSNKPIAKMKSKA